MGIINGVGQIHLEAEEGRMDVDLIDISRRIVGMDEVEGHGDEIQRDKIETNLVSRCKMDVQTLTHRCISRPEDLHKCQNQLKTQPANLDPKRPFFAEIAIPKDIMRANVD